MKKKLTVLFLVLAVISTTLFAISMVSFSSLADVNNFGKLTFENFSLGAVTIPQDYVDTDGERMDDYYFINVQKMGSNTAYEIVKENNETFYRTTSTSDSNTSGGHYFGLQNLVPGKYEFTLTLRFSEGATLKNNLSTKTRLDSETSTDKVLDTLYQNATADANGWKTISYEITTAKSCSTFRLYNQFKKGGQIDLKEITISCLEAVEPIGPTPSVDPITETEANTMFNLSEYIIVYAEYEAEHIMKYYEEPASFTEWDFNRLTAEELKTNIKNTFNVDLPIVKDTTSNPTDKEILIGNTNRKDYQGYLGLDFVKDAEFTTYRDLNVKSVLNNYEFSDTDPFKYAIGLQGNDIYIVGGCYGTTYAASNYFLDYLKANLVDGKMELDANWKITGTHDLEVIGCIGDSITHGVGSSGYDRGYLYSSCYFSYPAYLQRMNWKTSYVYNFAVTSTTMRENAINSSGVDKSYQKCVRWPEAIKMATVLDKVLIGLGANDSLLFPHDDWTNEDNQAFYDGFFSIIDALNEKNKDIEYLFVNCTKSLRNPPTGCKDFILQLQENCVNQAKAKGYTIELFDMRTLNETKITPDLYVDKTHFNSEGYFIMAEGINNALIENFGPIEPNNPNTPPISPENSTNQSGCGSSLGATSMVLSALLLAGATVIFKKKS